MYKKIIAMSLTLIMVLSLAATPIYAAENQSYNILAKTDETNRIITTLALYDKKDRDDDKGNKNKSSDSLQDVVKRFLDSEDLNWAEKSIEKLGALGIFSGNGEGYFLPKSNVTHAEAIAMVLRLTGYQKEAEAIKAQPEYFRGISDPWSYGYLTLAIQKGIIIPEEDGKINPKTAAKRHEIAKYVVRALGKRDLALQNMYTRLDFKDASSIPSKSVGYVYVINKLGIMQGSNNQFQANKAITRAEMAIILDKAEGKTDTPNKTTSSIEGKFVAFDEANYKLTLDVNGKSYVYSVNPHVPVYKDASYYGIVSLKAGDVVNVMLDSQGKIIFIELKLLSNTEPATEKLAIQRVLYENLPQALKDKVDILKQTSSFTAIRHEQFVYLIATRGVVPTGGYSISIEEVSKNTVQANTFNLKAVVKMANPWGAAVTQAVSYPYDIVKLNYFDGISKVNFVNEANTLLAQTAIGNLDNIEVINGKIDSVDTTYRILKLLESDGNVRAYYVPSTIQITIDNQAANLASLRSNMLAAITRTNGVMTKITAQTQASVVETINGKITTIDTANRVIIILGNDNNVRSFYIPANTQIIVNNTSTLLSSLMKDMIVVLTRTNGEITKVEATNLLETINGKIDSIDITNKVIRLLENDGNTRAYVIPSEVQITLNNQAAALSSLIKDMPAVITRVNGVITKLAATSIVETINGKIDAVDAATRIVKVLENDNVVRTYLIPTNVEITINNQAVAISALGKDMPLVITRTNGVITKLAATNTVETINGKVDSVDTANNIVRLLESDNAVRSYTIPATAPITLNNQTVALSSLTKGMIAVLTKTNGIITKLAVERDLKVLEGILVTTTVNNGKTYISVKIANVITSYEVTATTSVIYNNVSSTIQNIPLNSTIVITIENGALIEVRNK